MQTFKIEHYERIHGPGTFARFHHLTGDETGSVRDSVAEGIGTARRRIADGCLYWQFTTEALWYQREC